MSCMLSFLHYDKGIEKSLVIWSFGYRKQFLLSGPSDHCQNLHAAEGDTLPWGKVSLFPLHPHVCFHFYVMIKGLRRDWLFEVSESPSRGYWKQFFLSRLYEHSQNLHVVEGDTLPRGIVSPPTTLMHVSPSTQATVSHPTTELRWTLFPRLQYPTQQPS